jgi:hypothetical protein
MINVNNTAILFFKNSMRTLTLVAVLLAMLALVAPFAKEIWTQLWPFLQWLLGK